MRALPGTDDMGEADRRPACGALVIRGSLASTALPASRPSLLEAALPMLTQSEAYWMRALPRLYSWQGAPLRAANPVLEIERHDSSIWDVT